MRIWQAKALLHDIKKAIKYANDHAQYGRVQWLKRKRLEIKRKIQQTNR